MSNTSSVLSQSNWAERTGIIDIELGEAGEAAHLATVSYFKGCFNKGRGRSAQVARYELMNSTFSSLPSFKYEVLIHVILLT